MKVAAYQTSLLNTESKDALNRITEQVRRCESEGIAILCCPEAILGGLADYSSEPARLATPADTILSALASDSVTTIVGFTEQSGDGLLYNSAAIVQPGALLSIYRKLYPAINRSVYAPGSSMPVFQFADLTFGVLICNDSNYYEPARLMCAKGAAALFIPTNNSLSAGRARPDMVAEARNVDIARAVENSVWVIRADVAGRSDDLVSYGSSGIVDPNGMVVSSAAPMSEDLLIAEIQPYRTGQRRGWDVSRNRAVVGEYAAYIAGLVSN